MSIPPEDHHRQRLTEVKRIGLQQAERARKVYKFLILILSHSLFCFLYRLQLILELSAQDKVFELIMEGENLPSYLEQEIKVQRSPPPPLTKLLIFALLEKGKRKKEKKNICLGISLISQCLVGAVTTRTRYALLYLSKAI